MCYLSFLLQLISSRRSFLTGNFSLFKFRWNDDLVNYFFLMYCYGINTNIFHLTFSHELTISAILCRNVTVFPIRAGFFISSAAKIENVLVFKVKLFEQLFIDDSHVKIEWLHVVIFTEHDLLHLLKHYPVKVTENCFNSFNCPNQTGMLVSKFPFVLDK